MTKPGNRSSIIEHETQVRPLYIDLRARLDAGRSAADAAWAAKAASVYQETVIAVGDAVRSYSLRSPEIRSEEDATRLRAEFAEVLRSAANAIAPRVM